MVEDQIRPAGRFDAARELDRFGIEVGDEAELAMISRIPVRREAAAAKDEGIAAPRD